ncbi:MAG: hypothetical protein C0475_03355 [Planctomyces sp.]|nr:hypothetical protein [Planctomyces sp.]MBA4039066.1 hypothetical protein [Planctomyces sp.]MBA4119490.1 hypothetical protein [Isosphaera sp.]
MARPHRSMPLFDLILGAQPADPAHAISSAAAARIHTIQRIIQVNPSATEDFLAGFGDRALTNYLDHLDAASAPRGRQAYWQRRNETPAIWGRNVPD